MSRGDLRSNYEFVPLVREFLEARLASILDAGAIRAMHLALAEQFEKLIGGSLRRTINAPARCRRPTMSCADRSMQSSAQVSTEPRTRCSRANNGDPIVRGILRSRLLFQVGATAEAINEIPPAPWRPRMHQVTSISA